MASTRWLWTLGVLAFTGIVATVCLWSYYLGNTYMSLYISVPNSSRHGDLQLASVMVLSLTLLLVLGFCAVLAMTAKKSVIWIQVLIISLFATTTLFLWVFLRRHTPQFLPGELMPLISQEFIDSINRMYQLAVASTVCGIIVTLAFVGGILSNGSIRKRASMWIALFVGLLFACGLTLAYFELLASPHHSEPDMWVFKLLSQFQAELLISFVVISAFAIVLGWMGNRINPSFLLGIGSAGIVLAMIGAVLIDIISKMLSYQGWFGYYDLRQWTYALLVCVVLFAITISVGIATNRKRR